MSAVKHCRCHCRKCGGHFASLEAFDNHRSGPYDARECNYEVDLIEHDGICAIADPTAPPRVGLGVLSHPNSKRIRNYFATTNGAQAAPTHIKQAVLN